MKKILIGLMLISTVLLADEDKPSRLKGYVIAVAGSNSDLHISRASTPSFIVVDNNGKIFSIECRYTKVVKNMPLIIEKGITGRPLYELFESYKDTNGDRVIYEIK